MAELYKIQRVVTTGPMSTGETKLYESYDQFARDLFEFEMEALYYGDTKKHRELVRLTRIWYQEKFKNEAPIRHTKEVITVQTLKNGEWADVKYRVNEPSISIYLDEDR